MQVKYSAKCQQSPRPVMRFIAIALSQVIVLQSLATSAARAQSCGDLSATTSAAYALEGMLPEAAPQANAMAPEPDSMATDSGSASAEGGDEDSGDKNDAGAASSDAAGTDGTGEDVWRYVAFRSWSPFSPLSAGSLSPLEQREKERKKPVEGLNIIGDPIDLRLANKVHVQVDYLSAGSAPVRFARVYNSNPAVNVARVTVPMGTGWHMFYDRSLQVLSASQVRLHRANGHTLDLSFDGTSWVSALPVGVLTQISGGWRYVNHRDAVETYDTSGRLLSLSTGGLALNLQYDGTGRLIAVSNPFNRGLSFSYDGAGRIASVTIPGSSTLSYAYDARGNLVSVRFPDNAVRQYLYENTSFTSAMTGVVDETGRRRVSWEYDAQGRPNYTYYGTGLNAVSVVYNGAQVTTTDARGTQRVRTYGNVAGRQVLSNFTTLATPDSATTAWTLTYDANGNLSSAVMPTGQVQQYVHDVRGRVLSATEAQGTSQAVSRQTTWHPTFRKPMRVVARGVTEDHTIDAFGRVTQVLRTAAGQTLTMASAVYNAQGLLQSITDARGAVTSYTYDALGNRTSEFNALGQTTLFQNHNASGLPTRIQRGDGVVITQAFDVRGRLISRTVAGLTTAYEHDAAGRTIKTTAHDGAWLAYTYDSAGLISATTNHRSETTAVARDVAGVPVDTSVRSAAGTVSQRSTRQTDAVGRVAAVIDSRNYLIRNLFASDGRLSGVTDPLNLTRSLQLDVLDRPTVITIPNTTAMRILGGPATTSISHGYDSMGNPNSAVDTNIVATGYAHDPFNRRIAESGNDAGSVTVVRNASGDITSTTDARGITLPRNYDALGRLTSITNGPGTLIGFSYVTGRNDRLPASMTDPAGTTSWTYDSLGRVLSQSQTVRGYTRTVGVARDTLGRPILITYPSGAQVAYTYSGDVVSSISVNSVTLLNTIAYRPYSQTASSWRWGNGSTYTRSFDADGRITSVSLGPTQRAYTHDPAGRITAQTDTGSGTRVSSYAYDEAGQLITYTPPSGSGQTFDYDTNGNRRSEVVAGVARSYTYVAGSNRLASISGGLRSYQYNNDGNAGSDGRYSLIYDTMGRLAAANTATQKVNSVYNGLGLRVLKTVSQYSDGTIPFRATSSGTTGATTDGKAATSAAAAGTWTTTRNLHFVYDDSGHLLGEYNTIGGASQETVWFNNQPVATLVNGVLYYAHADHLGTPRSLTRPSDNAEVWRWDSDPFGTSLPTNPTAGANVAYNLRFAGQYFDTETRLHYNGMRDYDPRTGRYVQADPIGLQGGLARYSYVGANPLTYVDPYGLAGVKVGWAGGGAVGIGGSAGTGFYFSPDAVNPAGGYMSLQQEYGFGASITFFQIGFFAGKGTTFLENSGPSYSFNLFGAGLAVTFGKNINEGLLGMTGVDLSFGPGFRASKTVGEGKTYIAPLNATCPK